MPLVMDGRDPAEKVAATRAAAGTDVNFGALTHGLFRAMNRAGDIRVHLQHEVRDLTRRPDGGWRLTVKDLATGRHEAHRRALRVPRRRRRGAAAAAELGHPGGAGASAASR